MARLASLYPLDKNFVPPKPIEITPDDTARNNLVSELADKENLDITLKRDGWGFTYIKTGDKKRPIALYTRSGNEKTDHFPWVVDELNSMPIPKFTLGCGEIHFFAGEGKRENLGKIAGITNSAPKKALETQQSDGPARLMLFAPLIVAGVDIAAVAFRKRYAHVNKWLDKGERRLISGMRFLHGSFEQLKNQIIDDGLEGLVLYDGDAGTEYGLNGRHENPPRPEGCWKWLPNFHDDFIATKFEPGKGRNTGLAGKIYIAQIDPRTKDLVPCGEVPLHSKEHKVFFANPNIYPIVVDVEYKTRTDSGALRIAEVLHPRSPLDKGIDECVLKEKYLK